MQNIRDVVEHMCPGCIFDTDVPKGGFGEITRWAVGNPLPQPSHEAIVAYAEANDAAIALFAWRRDEVVSIRAFRRALLAKPGRQGGETLLDEADALAQHPDTPREAREDWMHCIEVERRNADIAAFGAALLLSEEEIDDLFRDARAIVVAAG